jgi:hypothetical protein
MYNAVEHETMCNPLSVLSGVWLFLWCCAFVRNDFLFPPLLPLLRSLKITRHPDATTACVCVCMYIPMYVCARVCALNSVEDEKERDKMMPKASKSSSTPKIPVGLFAGVCLCVFVCACGNIHIF